ncbi:hypothetical protein T492DRAFT_174924 [Pavlovales sp. CCMP2436]|nr:hypothetical protein T492DRAFT_174924 [Pavlovales sp. CCMP2436]
MDDVVRAVSVLYGTDALQQAEANRWLMAFAETPAAWDLCCELVLSAPASEHRFFGANVLLTKVRREWAGLGGEARNQVFGALSTLVVETSRREQGGLACKRLCLAVGAAAAQQAELCAPCLSMALELGGAEHGQGGAVAAFALLCALPDEIEQLASGGGGGEQPAGSSRAGAEDLLPFAQPVARLVEAHVAPRAGSSAELRKSALSCLRAWAGSVPQALTLRMLAEAHGALLEGLLAALADEVRASLTRLYSQP